MTTILDSSSRAISFAATGQPAGAIVRGLDLRAAPSSEQTRILQERIAEAGVLVFPEQGEISEAEQLAFTRAFGETQGHPLPGVGGLNPGEDSSPEVFYLSNATEGANAEGANQREVERNRKRTEEASKGGAAAGELGWHTDLQYMPEPQVYSLLYGVEIPSRGGDTEWASLTLAYEALDDRLKEQIAGLKAITWYTRRIPPVAHPLVRVHPITGKKSLYVSTLSRLIEGWDEEDGKALIRELTQHATKPEFCYLHHWRKGDALLWDNRCTLHRRHGFDTEQLRIVRRTQTKGEPVIPVQ